MPHFGRIRTTFAGLIAIAGLACADGTSPTASTRSAKHPLIGVYDVTTVLDSVSIERSGSDCGGFTGSTVYCVLIRPSTGGLLRGTLIVGDSVIRIDTVYPGVVGLPPRPIRDTIVYELPLVSGTFVGEACASLDYEHLLGCLAYADTLRADYRRSSAPIATGSFPGTQRRFIVTLLSTSPEPQRTLTLTTTRDAGDTIWGRLSWQTESGRRNPTRFYGEFRAVQRR